MTTELTERRWAAAIAAVHCPWCGARIGEQCAPFASQRLGEPHMTRLLRYARTVWQKESA